MSGNTMHRGNHGYDFSALSNSYSNGIPSPKPMPSYRYQSNADNQLNMPTDNFYETGHTSRNSGPLSNYDGRMRFIAQASKEDLMRAHNNAYMSLHDDFVRLQGQLLGKDEAISTLKALLREFPRTQAPAATTAIQDGGSGHFSMPPSPDTCDKADYLDVKFWTQVEWHQYQSKSGAKRLDFLTDENGEVTSNHRLKEMSAEARILFNELYRHRKDPETWSARHAVASAFFSNSMRQKFPEFRWCEGDWKVQSFATARFPSWAADTRAVGRLKREQPSINSSQQQVRKRKTDSNDTRPKKKKKHGPKTTMSATLVDPIDLTLEQEDGYAPMISERAASAEADALAVVPAQDDGVQALEDRLEESVSLSSEPVVEEVVSTSTPASGFPSPTPPLQISDNAMAASTSNTSTFDVIPPSPNVQSLTGAVVAATSTPATSSTFHPHDVPANIAPNPSSSTDFERAPVLDATTESESVASEPVVNGDENLFARLSIPFAPVEGLLVTKATSTGSENVTNSRRLGIMVPTNALTPRNLFAIDYMKGHPDTTQDQFKEVWKETEKENGDTLKKYKTLSNQRRKEAKKTSSSK